MMPSTNDRMSTTASAPASAPPRLNALCRGTGRPSSLATAPTPRNIQPKIKPTPRRSLTKNTKRRWARLTPTSCVTLYAVLIAVASRYAKSPKGQTIGKKVCQYSCMKSSAPANPKRASTKASRLRCGILYFNRWMEFSTETGGWRRQTPSFCCGRSR